MVTPGKLLDPLVNLVLRKWSNGIDDFDPIIRPLGNEKFDQNNNFLDYPYLKNILGAQLSYHCLSIDGSSRKCWSILTYPKRHESSLDIR